jgi:poly(3-hydroxybutyrate) depolymerase
MRLLTSLVLKLLLLTTPTRARSEKILKESITFNGAKRNYYLFLPEKVSVSPAPLIVLLHGSGRNGLSLVEK